MHITAPYLQTFDKKLVLMMPEGSKFPFRKIKLDYVICSHTTWKDQKYEIKKHTLNKPKVIYLD